MLGNVWEWCHDNMRTYTDKAVDDPEGPTKAGADRVVRGGSWADHAQGVRAACFLQVDPGSRGRVFGFRSLSSGVSQAAPEAR